LKALAISRMRERWSTLRVPRRTKLQFMKLSAERRLHARGGDVCASCQ